MLHTFVGVFFIDVFWIIKEAGVGNNDTYTETEEVKNWRVPTSVTLGKIVIDSDNVNTALGEGIEVGREQGDQGFTFTGFHLSNIAFVKCNTANHLYIKMTHAKNAEGGFTDKSKGIWEELI